MQKKNKKNILLINAIFTAICAAILIFLLRAPKETTAPLPHDDNHNRFFSIESKKEAELSCLSCHDKGKEAALPENHPPKYRCLFCHKRNL
ncbi:MAG: hypothetical protein KJ630_20220 [Proteobacteria bacterium]|nr:hypothetical protein [Pseudomonadota bacterium]